MSETEGDVARDNDADSASPAPGLAATRLSRLRGVLQRREVWGFLGYLAAQTFCVAGLVTERYPDSLGYFHLSFIGRAEFPPTVPFVYAVLQPDSLRVAAQAALAAISWWALARIGSSWVRDRRVRIGTRGVLLMLGLAGPVVSWNSVILSESIAISLTALAAALWLWFQQKPSPVRGLAALACSEAWMLSKPAHILIGALLSVVAILPSLRRRRGVLRIAMATALAGLSVFNVAVFAHNSNIEVGVLSDIIQDRILLNPSYTAWFVAQGMPYSSSIQSAAGGPYGTALQQVPALEAWMTDEGTATYERFLLTHPAYTLLDPLPSFSGERSSLHEPANGVYGGTDPNPTPSILSPTADYGRYRQVLPTVVEEFLFEQGQIGDLVALAAATALSLVVARRRGWDRRLVFPALLVASVIPHGYLLWLSGGVGEVDRLSMIVAVSVRIGLLLLLAFSLDTVLTSRQATGTSAAAPLTAGPGGFGARVRGAE